MQHMSQKYFMGQLLSHAAHSWAMAYLLALRRRLVVTLDYHRWDREQSLKLYRMIEKDSSTKRNRNYVLEIGVCWAPPSQRDERSIPTTSFDPSRTIVEPVGPWMEVAEEGGQCRR